MRWMRISGQEGRRTIATPANAADMKPTAIPASPTRSGLLTGVQVVSPALIVSAPSGTARPDRARRDATTTTVASSTLIGSLHTSTSVMSKLSQTCRSRCPTIHQHLRAQAKRR